jgi:hypothetical protein
MRRLIFDEISLTRAVRPHSHFLLSENAQMRGANDRATEAHLLVRRKERERSNEADGRFMKAVITKKGPFAGTLMEPFSCALSEDSTQVIACIHHF